MRTLIDVSLFVHTRRAWHGKQYFTPGDNSCRSVTLRVSVFPPLPLSLCRAPGIPRSALSRSHSFDLGGPGLSPSPFAFLSLPPARLDRLFSPSPPPRVASLVHERAHGAFPSDGPGTLLRSHRQSRHGRTDGRSYEPRVSVVSSAARTGPLLS